MPTKIGINTFDCPTKRGVAFELGKSFKFNAEQNLLLAKTYD